MALKLATIILIIVLVGLLIVLCTDFVTLMRDTATVETGNRIIGTIVCIAVVCLVLVAVSGLETQPFSG